jgi:preprotein translocase SecE subunit
MAETIRTLRDFGADVQEEMKKVTWPDWPQLKNSTFVIVVFMIVVALTIFLMDQAVSAILEVIRGVVGS